MNFHRNRFFVFYGAFWVAAILCAASSFSMAAQAQVGALAPPTARTIDPLGVDVMSQSIDMPVEDLSIGSGVGELKHVTQIAGLELIPWAVSDNFVGGLNGSGPFTLPDGSTWVNYGQAFLVDNGGGFPQVGVASAPACPYQVSFGDISDCFASSGGTLYPIKNDGSTLTYSNGVYTYTSHDGVVITIPSVHANFSPFGGVWAGFATQVSYPNGLIIHINWNTTLGIINSVSNNFGYMLKYSYITVGGYQYLNSVTAINLASEYCDPSATPCTLTKSWKSTHYIWSAPCTLPASGPNNACSTFTLTDQAGSSTKYTLDTSYRITAIQPATSSTNQYTFNYCKDAASSGVYCKVCGSGSPSLSDGTVPQQPCGYPPPHTLNLIQAVKEGRTWNYSTSTSGSTGVNGFTGVSTDADNRQQIYMGWATNASGLSAYTTTSPPKIGTMYVLNMSETYNYGVTFANHVQSYTGHGYTENYVYDSRDNLTSATKVAPSGSGLANIVRSAVYPSACVSLVTCNKPTSVTDARGNTTVYTYDPTHGGVLTATSPADANGVHPQTRYTYAQMSAYYLNASGAMVASPNPVWVLTQESACRTGAASGAGCAIAGDEVRKTYLYGAAGTVNNLLLRGVIEDSEPGGKAATTCYGYDVNGNMISKTLPNARLTTCP